MFRLKAASLKKASMREPLSLGASLARIGAVAGGYLLVIAWVAHSFGATSASFAALGLSVVAVPLIIPGVLGVIPAFFRWAGDRSMDRWQGCYYAFENRQIRIVEERARIWVVLADVVAVTQLRINDDELLVLPRGSVALLEEFGERAVSDTGLLDLLSRRNYREAIKFRRWLERDVLPPLYRKRSGQRVPDQFEKRDESAPPGASGDAP